MLDIFYNYAVQAHISARNGIICPPLFCFADYVECRLTVFDSKMARMDLSHVASWSGAIDVDENSGTEPLVRLLPGLFNSSGASNGEIRFPADCNTINFQSGVSKKTTGSLEIYGYDSSDRRVIRVKIPVDLGLPNDLPGDHEPGKVPPSAVRTLNNLSGNVEIVDADGNALDASDGKILVPAGVSVNTLTGAVTLTGEAGTEVSGQEILIKNLHEDSEPLDAYQAYSDTQGPYTWLDTTDSSPTLTFYKYQRNLKKVTFLALADNEESTGDVRLIAAVDGVDVATFTVAITATAELITLPLEVAAGMLTIRRPTDDELDTLSGAVRIFSISTWRATA